MLSLRAMNAKGVTPILNVSDIAASLAWFAKWGWEKLWDWGTPPTFGAVGSGEVDTEKRKADPFPIGIGISDPTGAGFCDREARDDNFSVGRGKGTNERRRETKTAR